MPLKNKGYTIALFGHGSALGDSLIIILMPEIYMGAPTVQWEHERLGGGGKYGNEGR